jgi:inosine-uridine nucleoside N-ribohydrolase
VAAAGIVQLRLNHPCLCAAVVAGAGRPLIRPLKVCPEIHGDSGLDGHEYVAGLNSGWSRSQLLTRA